MMIDTVEEALQGIAAGKLIVVATDTVLGIIADGSNEKAVHDLYTLKKRDKSKSAVVLLNEQAAATQYAKDIPEYAQKFMSAFWPGALTLVFSAKRSVQPQPYLAQPQSIALRVPNTAQLLELLRRTPKTIISTSANMSGQRPCRSLAEAKEVFGEDLLYWKEQKPMHTNVSASTIIDVQDAEGWQILREGAISKEMLWCVLDQKENKGGQHNESSNWQ